LFANPAFDDDDDDDNDDAFAVGVICFPLRSNLHNPAANFYPVSL